MVSRTGKISIPEEVQVSTWMPCGCEPLLSSTGCALDFVSESGLSPLCSDIRTTCSLQTDVTLEPVKHVAHSRCSIKATSAVEMQ